MSRRERVSLSWRSLTLTRNHEIFRDVILIFMTSYAWTIRTFVCPELPIRRQPGPKVSKPTNGMTAESKSSCQCKKQFVDSHALKTYETIYRIDCRVFYFLSLHSPFNECRSWFSACPRLDHSQRQASRFEGTTHGQIGKECPATRIILHV